MVNMWSNPNFHGIKRNTIFPTQMESMRHFKMAFYQPGRVSFCRVHDQATAAPSFPTHGFGPSLALHSAHGQSHSWMSSNQFAAYDCRFHPATFLQRPTLHQSIQALIASHHNNTWHFSYCFQAVQVPRGSSPWMFVERRCTPRSVCHR